MFVLMTKTFFVCGAVVASVKINSRAALPECPVPDYTVLKEACLCSGPGQTQNCAVGQMCNHEFGMCSSAQGQASLLALQSEPYPACGAGPVTGKCVCHSSSSDNPYAVAFCDQGQTCDKSVQYAPYGEPICRNATAETNLIQLRENSSSTSAPFR